MDEQYYRDFELSSMDESNCPIVFAMGLIGQKWKLPILWRLAHYQTMHYNDLKRHVPGITNTVLTRALREMETDGLINRRVYPTTAPSVEYSLTDAGKNLMPAMAQLYKWGVTQMKLSNPSDDQI